MTDRAPLRVAFTHIPRRLWAGGHNYQSNLFAALNRYRPGEIVPVVFAGMDDDAAELAALARIPGVEVVQSAAFDRRRSGLAAALAFGLDGAAAAEFSAKSIDLVFEAARFFGWRLPFPAVAWFPDFQHRRLPQLFSPAARWRRDLGFRAQIASGRTHHAEQRKRAAGLPQVLSGFDERHLGGPVCDAARARPPDRESA